MSTRPTRIGSTDLLEMEGGNLPSPKNQTSGLVSLFSTKNGEAHSTKSAAQQPPSVNALQYKSVSMDTAMVLQNKYRSWSRHLTLYCILGNLGMLLTVTSDNESGALSRVFCIGTYGHVFMEGSILLRLLFPPSQNYKLQMMHNYWGICTLLALIFFGNTFGELLWAAESILTDSMSLLLGAWLIQADVAPQVKLIGLSHFIHGITFEFFLWFDIAALSATYTATRGVFWVILVVANAVSQVIFHGPVIQGDFAASNKAQTPPPQSRRNLVCLWLCHNIFSIPLVLMFSTLGENHFYLEETHILPIYQVMIYTIPLPGLMIILYIFLRSKHAPYVSLAEENGIDHIDKPVEYEVHQGARVPQTRPPQRETIEAVRVLGNVFSSVSGTMLHSVFQLLLGTVSYGIMMDSRQILKSRRTCRY